MSKIVYYSQQGNTRQINEDALLVQQKIFTGCGTLDFNTQQNSLILAVADGMGGYEKGDLASYTVLEHLAQQQPKTLHSLIITLMEAKNELENIAVKKKIHLGTAFAGVLYENKQCSVVNVGDCRVYKMARENMKLISKDHTLVEQLKNLQVKNPILQKQKNILTSAITGGLGNEDFEIFQTTCTLADDEQLLLCSDGFWNVFEAYIPKIIESKDPLHTIKKLSKNHQTEDDCSFILFQNSKYLSPKHRSYDKMIVIIKKFMTKLSYLINIKDKHEN